MSNLWALRTLPEDEDDLPAHLDAFDCGKTPLNRFLRRTAFFNQQAGVSRTTYCHPPGFAPIEGAKHMFLRTSTARKLFAKPS